MGAYTGIVAKRRVVSIDELREALEYFPETGEFFWKTGRRSGKSAGTRTYAGYTQISIKGVSLMAHRIAWAIQTGEWPEHDIDHINGVPADNRLSNLRHATRSQNLWNTKRAKNNSTGLKGVCRHRKRFMAQINHLGKSIYLGKYNTAEEASAAYNEAASRLFGSFSNPSGGR